MWKIVLPFVAAIHATESLWFTMPGGLFDKKADDTDVQEVLSFFTVQHNIGTNDTYLHQVREVVQVQAQVVEGINYYLTVNMARSTCKKDDAKDEECVVQTEPTLAHSYQCKFSVWSRPWLNDIRLVYHKC